MSKKILCWSMILGLSCIGIAMLVQGIGSLFDKDYTFIKSLGLLGMGIVAFILSAAISYSIYDTEIK